MQLLVEINLCSQSKEPQNSFSLSCALKEPNLRLGDVAGLQQASANWAVQRAAGVHLSLQHL